MKETLRNNETILGKNLSECQSKELQFDSLKFKAKKYQGLYHQRTMAINEDKKLILKYSKWLQEEKREKEQLISIIKRHPRVTLNRSTITRVVANEISTLSTPPLGTHCHNTKKG